MVLGLFEHAAFEEETLTLEPGDFIVAFSDGVTEALNEQGEEFTDDRLLACVDATDEAAAADSRRPPRRRARVLPARRPQNDDVTVVMVRYGG